MAKTKDSQTNRYADSKSHGQFDSASASSRFPQRVKVIGICILLTTLVFVVFGQTIRHEFINYDDNEYVYENPIVSRGLSLSGFVWAFTHVHSANWHPLTTLSHMCDCQLYGLWAGGHHLDNVLLHAAAAILLFLMLREMTGSLWRSAFVAAVFAIHPLRVESVAWVAERKDVLSGVFFMLTLSAYVRYVRAASVGRYAMLAAWFALGLMSKPMMVTVPFVLLLLDYWPLGRLQNLSAIPGLVREKIPLFALSVLSCAATVLAQKQAIRSLQRFSILTRISNALTAYAVYINKLIFPSHLAVFYPLTRNSLEIWEAAVAGLVLVVLTYAAYMSRREKPFLLIGWLWYLGMLVPVIGILQVGQQAYADRYTYLPQIGLCIAGTWAIADWSQQWRHRRVLLAAAAAVVLSFLSAAAFRQTTFWKDSFTLWTHTLECTRDNFVAHYNLGTGLALQGRTAEAIVHFREAVRINPGYLDARNNLGTALFMIGETAGAITQYEEVLRIDPNDALVQFNLANCFATEGRASEAIAHFREALRIDPNYEAARKNLNSVLGEQERTERSYFDSIQTLRLQP